MPSREVENVSAEFSDGYNFNCPFPVTVQIAMKRVPASTKSPLALI